MRVRVKWTNRYSTGKPIVRTLKENILSGSYPPGPQLPTEAMDETVRGQPGDGTQRPGTDSARRAVVRIPARGTFVRRNEPLSSPPKSLRMGAEAVRLLIRRLRNPDLSAQHVVFYQLTCMCALRRYLPPLWCTRSRCAIICQGRFAPQGGNLVGGVRPFMREEKKYPRPISGRCCWQLRSA
mgnify:FL=1